MSQNWVYYYDETDGKTVIYWSGDGEEAYETIDGQITQWAKGYPNTDAAREAVKSMIQSAETSNRILMQFDFNYGFDRVNEDPRNQS